jgi:hypothetical protein
MKIIKTEGTKTSVGSFMIYNDKGNDVEDENGNNAWDTYEEAERVLKGERRMKIIYGYDLVERTKFEMSIGELCRINNNEDGLNSNCYIYTTEEDRDLHFEQNVENK